MGDPLQELLLSPGMCPGAVRPPALSAADLHACLQRLRQRSDEVKAKVREFLTALSDVDKTVDDVAPLAAEIPRLLERLLPGILLGAEDDKDLLQGESQRASDGLNSSSAGSISIIDGSGDVTSITGTASSSSFSSSSFSSSSFSSSSFSSSLDSSGLHTGDSTKSGWGEISKSVRSAGRVKRELREMEECIDMVEMVVGAHEVMLTIDKHLMRGKIVDAARALIGLEKAIIRAGVKREGGGKDEEEEYKEEEEEEEEEEEKAEGAGGEVVVLAGVSSEGGGEGVTREESVCDSVDSSATVPAGGGVEERGRELGTRAGTRALKQQQQCRDEEGVQREKEEKVEEGIRVFGILKSEFAQRKAKLKSSLESLFRRALVVDRIQCELRWMPKVQQLVGGGKSGKGSGAPVHAARVGVSFGDILDALELTGWLDLKLASLADTIFTRIFLAVLRDERVNIEVSSSDRNGPYCTDVKSEMADDDKTAAEDEMQGEDRRGGPKKVGSQILVLSWRAKEEGEKVGDLALSEALRKILLVVQFIREHIMGGKLVRMKQLGRILWPRLAEAIIKGPLGKAVPNKTEELAGFQKVADLTVEFEQSLVREGLISLPNAAETADGGAPADDGGRGESESSALESVDKARTTARDDAGRDTSRDLAQVLLLSTFAADVDVHFAVKKRKRVLVRARDLLMQSDFAPVVVCSKSEIVLDRSLLKGYKQIRKDDGEGTGRKLTSFAETESDAKAERINDQDADPDSVLEPEVVELEGVNSHMSKADLCDDEVEADEEGRFFLLEKCCISVAAKQLVLIAHEAMEEACVSTERTAMELYHAGRDALLMYRAIVPVKHAAQLSRSALLGMLLYNDGLYIAHHLMTMGIQYRRSLLPSLRNKVVFVDMSRSFQLMAEDACLQHIELQHSELMKALDQGKEFQYTDDPQHYRDADSAMRQVVDILMRLAAIWKPILSKKAYLRIMGAVMDGAVARLVADVISLQDMAEEETVQLRSLLSYFVKAFPLLLGFANSVGSGKALEGVQSRGPLSEALRVLAEERAEAGGNSVGGTLYSGGQGPGHMSGSVRVNEESTTMTGVLPSWKKLLKLIDLLALHLTPLAEAWESGELYSSGFTQAEVQHLVEAIFSETPQRKDCLMRILAKNFGEDSA